MKVGIIIHSQSGCTASLSQAISVKLKENNIDVDIHLLRPDRVVRSNTKNIGFRKTPDISEYDTILIGGPVWSFTASPVVVAYLKLLTSLKGKRALSFATYAIPWKIFGATKAIERMNDLLDMSLADILEGETMFKFLFENKTRTVAAVDSIVSKILA